MATDKFIKIAFKADTSDLTSGLKKADSDVTSFGDRVGEWGKKAAAAFAVAAAAAAAYAGKLAIDGVKAAMEDQAAQEKLAATLENVTGATREQIGAVEAWISATQLAFGVSDSQLRPAFERLVRATKDVGEAQKLTTLALDVAKGSGKDLETVSNALGKAYEGNTTALGKLGLGIDKAQLKTMDFNDITKVLSDTFGGQAARQAETFQGKVARLSEAWGEAKETVGGFIIDALTPLLNIFTGSLIPKLGELSEQLGKNLKEPFEAIAKVVKEDLFPILKGWWTFLSETVWPGIAKTIAPVVKALGEAFTTVGDAIKDNKDKLQPLFDLLKAVGDFIFMTLGPILGTLLGTQIKMAGEAIAGVIKGIATVVDVVTKGIQGAINLAIGGINTLIRAWNAIPDWLRPGGKVDTLSPVSLTGGGGSGINVNDLDAARYTAQLPKTVTTVPTVVNGGGGGGGGGGGSSTKTTNSSTSNSDANQVAVDMYNAASLTSATALLKASNTLDAIMAEIAALKATPTTVVIEGALVDPEGAARAIETVLYQANVRTGGGGLLSAVAT